MIEPSRLLRRFSVLGTTAVLVVTLSACGGSDGNDGGSSNAQTLLNEGIKAQTDGDLPTATAKFNAVIAKDPNNKIAYYDLGLIQQSQGNAALAEGYYRSAIKADPNYAPALYNLGILRAQAGANAEAIDLYTRATVADPKNGKAYLNLGLLLRGTDRKEEAEAAIAQAVKLEPDLASRVPATTAPPSTAAPQ